MGLQEICLREEFARPILWHGPKPRRRRLYSGPGSRNGRLASMSQGRSGWRKFALRSTRLPEFGVESASKPQNRQYSWVSTTPRAEMDLPISLDPKGERAQYPRTVKRPLAVRTARRDWTGVEST